MGDLSVGLALLFYGIGLNSYAVDTLDSRGIIYFGSLAVIALGGILVYRGIK